MLNNYLSGFLDAKREFPEVKEKCEAIVDKIKGMKDQIFTYLAPFEGMEKVKAGGLVVANLAILGRSLAIANEFLKKLADLEQELSDLRDNHKQIEKDADSVG